MTPRPVDSPQPGFFRLRLCKGGPWVPARISYGPTPDPETGEPLDRSPLWIAEIDGKELPGSPDPVGAGVFRIWLSGREISEQEFRFLLARKAHAEAYEPDLPEANPRERIDPLTCPTPF